MRPEVHLDPDGLRASAVDALRVAELLRPPQPDPEATAVCARLPGGRWVLDEYDRLRTGLARAADELVELSIVLRAAVQCAEDVDRDVRGLLERAAGEVS